LRFKAKRFAQVATVLRKQLNGIVSASGSIGRK
jgi:hypothetical protein